ncbi:hsp70 nucleotide exchange factor FES1 [Dioscorea cayenensis subsp. rotundata]|uniref:Hsp70 nucleotide exchange factor FES1 n=1 Tax=Dioscorea cayennensis subsp. rotundata TaxID=55577 RepID=A0AB40AT58_DIOCR|nr:hsp70 nucleotide exchange factor FES1 [Dioscorea cayenensis subsp. rotundata]
MAKASILLLLLLVSILFMSMVSLMTLAAERENHSSSNSLGGILWSTDMAEGDLLAMADSSPVEEHTDEFSGGFSSLDGMLQWAIGHSDPAKLKEKASDVRRLSADELKKRQLELKELMEKLKMPSDTELMRIAIADLNNSSLSLEDRQRALNELLILVEHIDNANDLDKLGGLVAVFRELYNPEPEIRITSAWILGKASQNNALVQNQILSLGALEELMKMVKSGSTEEVIKALYAVSALIRNNIVGQELFFSENGDLVLQDIMNDSSADIRLHKKAALLVSDLADYQLANVDNVKLPFFNNRLLLKSVVGLASSTDLDLQEKALSAIRSLLQLSYTEASVFKDFCDMDGVLERSRELLENLMTQEDLKEYAREIEALRREVYIIFHNKLAGKGGMGANMNVLAR